MTRNDIISSVKNIIKLIQNSNIVDVLDNTIREYEDRELDVKGEEVILAVLKEFSIGYYNLSEVEKKIIKIFQLDAITDAGYWLSLINDKYQEDGLLEETRNSLYTLEKFLPEVMELFSQDYSEIFLNAPHNRPKEFRDKEIITIILPEEEKHFSNPIRLSQTLEGITLLYQSCATILNESPDELSVLSLDSGSDKSFDFLGNAKVIECLKDFFLQLWDRVVFFRERKMGEKIELITKALPLIEKINESELSGKLGKEQAEILRRKIIDGTEKFITVGAVTRDIEKSSVHNPRQLMTPETKMW